MKISELRNLSKQELLEKEKELKQELFKLNQQRYTGNVSKPHQFSLVRKDIARVQTLLKPAKNTKAPIEDKISNGIGQKEKKNE